MNIKDYLKRRKERGKLGIDEASILEPILTVIAFTGLIIALGVCWYALTLKIRIGTLIIFFLGVMLVFVSLGLLWNIYIDNRKHRRIYAYICKYQHLIKNEESSQWLNEVEAQEIASDSLIVEKFPKCFLWEDFISPTIKAQINEPSKAILYCGADFLLFIYSVIILYGYTSIFVPELTSDVIIYGVIVLIYFLGAIWIFWTMAYKPLHQYYSTYQEWYDTEYFRLQGERGQYITQLQENISDSHAQLGLELAFQKIKELEEVGRYPLPSIWKLVVPVTGVVITILQLVL